jgi:hypothetical protein
MEVKFIAPATTLEGDDESSGIARCLTSNQGM